METENQQAVQPATVSADIEGTTLILTNCGRVFDATGVVDGLPWIERTGAIQSHLTALGDDAGSWVFELPEVARGVWERPLRAA